MKDLLLRNAAERPEADAFLEQRDGAVVGTNWSQVLARVNALGTSLLRDGRRPVFILGENSGRWLLAHCAAICGAGVAVGLDKELAAGELIGQIRQLDAGVVFYARAYEQLAGELEQSLPANRFVCLDGEDFERLLTEGESLLAAGDRTFMDARPAEGDLAAVLFTSGTTAGQKAVLLSQKNILTSAVGVCHGVGLVATDRLTMLLPLHHAYASYCAAYSILAVGGALCFFSGFKRMFDLMRVYRTNKLVLVPALVNALLAEMQAAGAQGPGAAERFFGFPLDYIICGGAPLAPAVIEELAGYGVRMAEGYGMTECSPLVSVNPPDAAKPGTVGRVIPGCEVRLAPDGEIMVRGDNVMLGYLNNPEAQARAFRDGWLLSGDIGSLDEDGYLTILGRKKNMILLSNGKNVFPEELEDKLCALPGILETCVFQDGDDIVAEVWAEIPPAQVEAAIRELGYSLPPHQRIRRVVMRDTPFVRSSLGKIIRR